MQRDNYTIQEKMLSVGDGHTLNAIEWGNKKSNVKIIFLHGGPGSQIKDKYKSAFNPELHHVVFFDQRGAGKSTPSGSLENNTTEHLVEDISKVADHFGFNHFYLHGSSWGSALALAYSLVHPKRVKGLVIGGVYTGSQSENDWIGKGRFKPFYPDVWDAYLDRTPEEYRDNPSAYHFDKILNGTPEEQKLSGYAYDCLESGVIKLDDRSIPEAFEDYDSSGIRLEVHYISQNCFMMDRHILDNAHQLTMPIWMVHGRYDMVCPPQTAYELHHRLSNSKLYWSISGHGTEHENENIFRAILAELE